MLCVAYRRHPSERDKEIRGDIATLNTETRAFTQCDRQLTPVGKSFPWSEATPYRFSAWVMSYPEIWSLHPHEAYWFDHALTLDEGL